MQVQNISNQPNFKGNIILVGEFSAVPTKLIRNAVPKLKELMEKKPYDLFIEQQRSKGIVSVYVQKEKDFMRNKGLKSLVMMKDSEDFYEKCAEYVIKEQDKKILANPTTGQKIKNIFDKISTKFVSVMQDKDEV